MAQALKLQRKTKDPTPLSLSITKANGEGRHKRNPGSARGHPKQSIRKGPKPVTSVSTLFPSERSYFLSLVKPLCVIWLCFNLSVSSSLKGIHC
jgi:hypothetical protein